jgi:glycosyltransferase involved in cell wall biosynthesis
MKIVVLSQEIPPVGGGAGNFALLISKELAKRGEHIYIYTMNVPGLPLEETKDDGVQIKRANVLRRDMANCGIISMLVYIIKGAVHLSKIPKKDLKLIYAHSIVPAGIIALLINKIKGTPYFITSHGSDVPGYNDKRFGIIHKVISPIWKMVLHHAHRVSVPSKFMKNLVNQMNSGKDVTVIPYGMDTDKYRYIPEEKEKTFLIVSRLETRKRYDIFLRAISRVETENYNLLEGYKIVIVGDGTEMNQLQIYAKNLKTKVTFLGWIDNRSAQMRELFEKAAVFVYPSTKDNFPVALMEAMSAGLAVITTKNTGCEEVVGSSGILVRPGSEEDMYKAIINLLEKQETIIEWQQKSRHYVDTNYACSLIANKYIEFLSVSLK